jgi:hypothetical protein
LALIPAIATTTKSLVCFSQQTKSKQRRMRQDGQDFQDSQDWDVAEMPMPIEQSCES